MQPTPCVSTFIIAPAGVFVNSLATVLATIPNIKSVEVYHDLADMLAALHERSVSLLLADSALFGSGVSLGLNAQKFLQECFENNPEMLVLLMVDSIQQQKQLLDLGFTHVLLKGSFDHDLREQISCLTPKQ